MKPSRPQKAILMGFCCGYLVPDVGSCQVIIKTLDVVYDLNLCVILPFVFPFDEGFVQVVWRKWLDKGSHFLGL